MQMLTIACSALFFHKTTTGYLWLQTACVSLWLKPQHNDEQMSGATDSHGRWTVCTTNKCIFFQMLVLDWTCTCHVATWTSRLSWMSSVLWYTNWYTSKKAKVKGGGIFRNVSTVHVIRDNNTNLSLYRLKEKIEDSKSYWFVTTWTLWKRSTVHLCIRLKITN